MLGAPSGRRNSETRIASLKKLIADDLPRAKRHRDFRRMLDFIGDRIADSGLRYLEATVTADNTASRALFASFALLSSSCGPSETEVLQRPGNGGPRRNR